MPNDTPSTTIDQTETHGRIRDGIDAARGTASKVYHSGRDKASDALSATRDTARQTVQTMESNPLGILVGGLAAGVLAGALLPRSAREKELLAPIGKRIGETAKAALLAAKDAGRGELDSLGLTKDAARGQVKSLFDGVITAATTAGSAAAKTAAETAKQKPA